MKSYLLIVSALVSSFAFAQLSGNGSVTDGASDTSAFLNASGLLFSSSNGFTADGGGNIGKGLVLPRTDLTTFTFTTLLLGDFPTQADGMMVFNSGTGSTPATGSGIGNQVVSPGFYYFSNPGSAFDTTNGTWLPLGGVAASIKEAAITYVVPAANNSAELDLDGAAATLVSGAYPTTATGFLNATVYAADNTVVVSSASYNVTTRVLTTGSGFINQVLPAGTYRVVVAYR